MKKYLITLLFLSLFAGCSKDKNLPNDTTQNTVALVESDTSTIKDKDSKIIVTSSNTEQMNELSTDDNEILENVRELCSNPRKYNTEGAQRAKDFITKKMNDYGYTTKTQEFFVYSKTLADIYSPESLQHYFETYQGEENSKGKGINLIATKTYDSSKKTLYITAHYDTTADTNGIRDNGSGVATVMEIARQLEGIELPVNVVYVFFSAEEAWLQGSYHFVSQLTEIERENAVGCINIDVVGASEDKTFVFNTVDEGMNALYLTMNEDGTYPLREEKRSDHFSFYMGNIPSVSISDYNVQTKDMVDEPKEELNIVRLNELAETICNKIIRFDLLMYEDIIKNSYVKEYTDINIDSDRMKILDIPDELVVCGYSLVQINKILSNDGSRSDIQYILKNELGNTVTITEYEYLFIEDSTKDDIDTFKDYNDHIKYNVVNQENKIMVRYFDRLNTMKYQILEGNLKETEALDILNELKDITGYGTIGSVLETGAQ